MTTGGVTGYFIYNFMMTKFQANTKVENIRSSNMFPRFNNHHFSRIYFI